ncbi:MAG: cell division protein ZapE [Pseudomonadota bacterium]
MDNLTTLQRYQNALQANSWTEDPAQLRVIQALDAIGAAVASQKPTGWRFWEKRSHIRGLYIWGSVGRGKTFLMDLFAASLSTEHVQRKHFHRFMSDVHDALAALKHQSDPLKAVADKLTAESSVLCLDEMHVNDIGDAMILGRLFEHLFDLGVCLITTSNVPPDGLYKDGLQRARFLPAIALLNENCEVLELVGGHDYRLEVLGAGDTYFVSEDACRDWAKERFTALTSGASLSEQSIEVLGRQIETEGRAPALAWFSFQALCQTARSQLDYISLAKRHHTIILSCVPMLRTEDDNAARRFINLVDEFYDRQVNLLISAAAPINELYAGDKLAFEFQRTASRLTQMQSREYHAAPHRP